MKVQATRRMPPSYESHYGKSYALIVGIDEYKYVSPLGFAKNDARAVASAFEKFGFDRENITVLLDREATYAAIRDAYLKFTEEGRIGENDRLVFFYAGHGQTISGIRGEVGFLVPYAGSLNEPKTLLRWDDLTRNADLIPAKHIFFIMDACYGGLAVQRAPALGSMRFLGDMLRRQARQVLTAGKANELVADGNGVRPGHSIFTAHLLNGLEGAAATKEGVLTANGLMAYVYDKVARDQYSHQTPHFGYLAGDGDFVFDTAPLDKLRADKPDAGTTGRADLLLNTAPQLAPPKADGESVVEQLKELLAEPSKRIKLDDFVSLHVRRFLEGIDQRQFPVQGAQPTIEEFVSRVQVYEKAVVDLQKIFILLARWVDRSQLAILEKALSRIAEADKGAAGFKVWLDLSWYPIVCLIYAAGISALAAKRYDTLSVVLNAPVQPQSGSRRPSDPIIVPAMNAVSELHDQFKRLPDRERNYVPMSEQLFSVLQPQLEDILFVGRSYEQLFDAFEMLMALDYADLSENGWAPLGRFGYKQRGSTGESPFDRLLAEAQQAGASWGPLEAGFFKGASERFLAASEQIRARLKELRWV
ncbi:caspase family protein [Bradyrhizobium sp. 48]|uniref:caspase family protein n=1 Tax=Bradyrhizobium sp. 48 TaxID=2782676 RepID=UPI001FFA000F|nr:caspase family protein [Bradyrhizobium sp. 48]MCK1446771.1 caspase family protein [Bradyrhizobium sp. 48]